MEIPVFFNSDAVISGDLLFASDLHINCEIIWNVESEKKIVIGPDGVFKGILKARELVVFGKLEGDIIIKGSTVLHPGSAVSGTLSSQIIEIIGCAFLDIRVNIINTDDVSESNEFYAEEVTKVFLAGEPVTAKTASVITEVKVENFEDLQQDNPPTEIVETHYESVETPKNFLFTHFSETNLNYDSMYIKDLFEVNKDLNSSSKAEEENHVEILH